MVPRGFLDPPLPQEGRGTEAMEQVTNVNKSNSIWLHRGDKRSQIAKFSDLNVNNNHLVMIKLYLTVFVISSKNWVKRDTFIYIVAYLFCNLIT